MSSGVIKPILDGILKMPLVADRIAKHQVIDIMQTKVAPPNLKGIPYIKKGRCYENIREAFNNKHGGAHLFAAPPGSGKTTYIRNYANEFIDYGGHVKVFGSELLAKVA